MTSANSPTTPPPNTIGRQTRPAQHVPPMPATPKTPHPHQPKSNHRQHPSKPTTTFTDYIWPSLATHFDTLKTPTTPPQIRRPNHTHTHTQLPYYHYITHQHTYMNVYHHTIHGPHHITIMNDTYLLIHKQPQLKTPGLTLLL